MVKNSSCNKNNLKDINRLLTHPKANNSAHFSHFTNLCIENYFNLFVGGIEIVYTFVTPNQTKCLDAEKQNN